MTKAITRMDVEIALIQMGRAVKALMEAYAPEANQTRITIVGDNIMVHACRYDGKDADTNINNIIDGMQFDDGVMHVGGEYITAKDGAA